MSSNVTINTPINTACPVLLETRGNSTAPLQGDPDIAGIGVIPSPSMLRKQSQLTMFEVTLSFILSAYICLVIAIVCYVHGMLPDALLSDYDREFIHLRSRAKGHWFKAFTSGMMGFSDSQILQGIAILIAGFANVRTLTVYHWQLVVYMAWYARCTHKRRTTESDNRPGCRPTFT